MRDEATDCPRLPAAGSSPLPHRPPAQTQPIRGVRGASEPIRGVPVASEPIRGARGAPEASAERGASAPFRGGNGASEETSLRETGEGGQSSRRSSRRWPCWEEEEERPAQVGTAAGGGAGADPHHRRCPRLAEGMGSPVLRGTENTKPAGERCREGSKGVFPKSRFGFIVLYPLLIDV